MVLEDQHKGGIQKSSREFVVERVKLCYYHVGLWAELRPRLFLGEHLTKTWRKVGRQLLCHVEALSMDRARCRIWLPCSVEILCVREREREEEREEKEKRGIMGEWERGKEGKME